MPNQQINLFYSAQMWTYLQQPLNRPLSRQKFAISATIILAAENSSANPDISRILIKKISRRQNGAKIRLSS